MYTTMRTYSFARVLFRAFLVLALIAGGFAASPGQPAAAAGAANSSTVLILSTSVSGGTSSQEAQAAVLAGMSVEIATPAQWAAKTAAEFATYRALILGDPNCVGYDSAPFPGATSAIGAAIANASVWGPAVTGKAILIGTDVYFHSKTLLAQRGIAFAVSEVGKTGAYITLSCYYHEASAGTPLALMNGFSPGGFTVTGVGSCFNSAHIVATHPALTGLTDAYLSGWSCSVHEAVDKWPVDWQVLAIARTGSVYTAPDGTMGIPYILARGVDVISDIKLTPLTGTGNVGTSYTLTATVKQDGVPTPGTIVTFTAIAGPNTGATSSGTTNASGQATATYTSAATGTDTWVARFTASERTQTSNTATVTWSGAAPSTPSPSRTVVNASSTACGQLAVSATGVTPGLPHQIVVTPSTGGALHLVNVTAEAAGTANATVDLASAFGTSGGTYHVYVRMTSNQVTVSNTAIVTAAACPTPTPTPATPRPPAVVTATPTPVATPARTPVPTQAAAIGRLPSTSTGSDLGTLSLALLGLLALGAVAWRKRATRT